MMGFGPTSSSSSSPPPPFSSLSALAPPFSIDRSQHPTKLTSNPLPQYSDFTSNPNTLNSNPFPPQYSQLTCAVDPFNHTWQYTQPSAPRSELIIDSVVSIAMPSMPPAGGVDAYQFSASTSTSPSNGYWSDPFYSPYVPPIAAEEHTLHEGNGPRYNEVLPPIDYMQGLYDLEYGPRWMGGNAGSSYGKQAEESAPDGSLLSAKPNFSVSHGYSNQLNQGHGTEYVSNYKEGTGVSCERFGLVSDSDLHTAFTGTRHLEDKPCFEQNLGFLPSDFSNKPISTASSSPLAARPLGLSSEMHTNFSDYHQNSCSKNKSSLWPVGSPFSPPVSTVKSSPVVVIRPPSMVSGVLGQNGVPRSTASSDNVGYAVFRNLDITSSSSLKKQIQDLDQILNADVKEDSFETDLLNPSNRVNYQIFGSPPVKELSAPLHTKNTHDHYTEARFVSQPPNVNVVDGFSEAQAVASAELSSDSVDRHSLGVDSPCWKGAHTSQFSWLDEDDHFNHSKKNEIYCSDHEKHENILSAVDSTRTPASACEGSQNQRTACSHDGEVSASNGAKPDVRVSAVTRSIGFQMNKDLDIPRKDSGSSNNLKSGFDMKISKPSNSKQLNGERDTGLTLNYVSDGDIAVHAAEKVLASPSSQDDTAERTKLQPDPRINVPMVIKDMLNLSELLLSHQSNDGFILEEKDNEKLKHIISNLDTCMSKNITQPIRGTNLDYPIGDTSVLGDSCMACPNMSTTSEPPQKTSELKDSHVQRDYWSMYEEGYDNSGNKDEKSPVFSPLRDDLDMAKDDPVTKVIKKVLDENFNFDEEMHSQALLFKSLWLEAEAKLCSISYRARFDRMKLEMDKLKPKAPIGNGNDVEILSKVDTSPIINNTDAEFIHKEYDGFTAKPLIEDSSLPTMHADEAETSVMTRFSILKSREENVNETETSVMTRFSILKSREDNMKPINEEEEKHPEIADGDSAGSIMDRFNILKSRVENSKSFNLEEEKTPEVSSAGFTDQNHLGTSIKDHYGLQEMLNSSVANDHPIINSFYDTSRMMNQQYSLWRGSSSSSDWEHVLKDDLAWKNP